MNPQDIASSRFKEIRKAEEQIAKTEATLAKATGRLEELRRQIGPAERRDREALGRALVDEKPEPASEAEKIRAEIAQQELRVEALRLEVERARGQIGELVKLNRGAWRRRAMQELGRDKQRYLDAIGEMEAARTALGDGATLISWLDSGDVSEAATDALGGGPVDDKPVLAFSRTLDELRRDCEHLAAHPDTPRDERVPEPRFELARGGVQGMRVPGWGGE
jgi:hypothetical protein